jgi:hypothetical protein
MIVFDLCCSRAHRFEGWFDSHEDLERQLAQGQIACPSCNDCAVQKVPSAVAIKKNNSAYTSEGKAREALIKLGRYVQDNFEDVGHEFTKEALKIHYGSVEERNIRGVTTAAEEKMLKEEGVSFLKIPILLQPDN